MSPSGAETDTESDPPYEALYDIVTRADAEFDARLTDVLALCCSYLGTDYGYLTCVEDDLQEVAYIHGDHDLLNTERAWPVSVSYCQCALDTDGPFEVTATTTTDQLDDRGRELFDLQSYLGTPLYVGDELALSAPEHQTDHETPETADCSPALPLPSEHTQPRAGSGFTRRRWPSRRPTTLYRRLLFELFWRHRGPGDRL